MKIIKDRYNKSPKSTCCNNMIVAIHDEWGSVYIIYCGKCKRILNFDGNDKSPTQFYNETTGNATTKRKERRNK